MSVLLPWPLVVFCVYRYKRGHRFIRTFVVVAAVVVCVDEISSCSCCGVKHLHEH